MGPPTLSHRNSSSSLARLSPPCAAAMHTEPAPGCVDQKLGGLAPEEGSSELPPGFLEVTIKTETPLTTADTSLDGPAPQQQLPVVPPRPLTPLAEPPELKAMLNEFRAQYMAMLNHMRTEQYRQQVKEHIARERVSASPPPLSCTLLPAVGARCLRRCAAWREDAVSTPCCGSCMLFRRRQKGKTPSVCR